MRKLLTCILVIVACSVGAQQWTGTWATAPQATTDGNMPNTLLSDCAVRQIVKVSLGSDIIRLKLSNEHGNGDLILRSVFVADASDSCDINKKTARFLTFDGKKNVTIPAGKAVYSDPLHYPLGALRLLAITINYQSSPEHITSHPGSRTTSYIIKGTAKPGTSFAKGERTDHWFNLSAIEVYADGCEAIAILGNSITDGRGSTTNKQNRWPDMMAQALGGNVGVLNLGIGGNCVLSGGLGEPAVERFDRDILGQSNVKTLIIYEGVNDIGTSKDDSEARARKLTEAYEDMARQAHERGWKVYAATITPFKGHGYFTFFHEAARQTVNEWIRQHCAGSKEQTASGKDAVFDGLIDFDALLRSDDDPARQNAEWKGDGLHPNAAGYEAMGEFAAKALGATLNK